MRNYKKHNNPVSLWLFLIGFLCVSKGAVAQDQNIGTESVTVVKTYAPIVMVGAKPILAPSLSDLKLPEKITLAYTLKKFPVASSFIPALGAANALIVEKAPIAYNSLLYLGFGLRATTEMLYDSRLKLSRYETLGLGLEHGSMASDLPEIDWDSNFFKTQLKGDYSFDKRGTKIEAGLKIRHLAFSWYGLDLGVSPDVDIQQGYVSLAMNGKLSKEKGIFKSTALSVGHFRDLTKSSEEHLSFVSVGRFPLGNVPLDIVLGGDYVGGQFNSNPLASFENLSGDPYTFYKLQMSPKISWDSNRGFFKMGAQLVYANPLDEEASNFKVYPDLYTHFSLLDNAILAFGSLTGNYTLNSFAGFVNENPFVSPSLNISPTDLRHALRLGLKGQFSELSYEAYWEQKSYENKALFVENPSNNFKNTAKSFNYGNSFEVVYEAMDQNTIGFSFAWQPVSNLEFRADYQRHTFNLTSQKAAWHLPKETAIVSLDYSFLKKFKFLANFNYTGLRTARESEVVQFIMAGEIPANTLELPAYHLIDMTFDYQLNQRLSLFAKAENLSNSTYEIWSGFVAPPRILMLGASYQFNL